MNETINWFKESGNELIPSENPTICWDNEDGTIRQIDESYHLTVDNSELCIECIEYYATYSGIDEWRCTYIEKRFNRKEVEQIRRFAAGEYKGYHRPTAVKICDDYEICIGTINDGRNFMHCYRELRDLLKYLYISLPEDEFEELDSILDSIK